MADDGFEFLSAASFEWDNQKRELISRSMASDFDSAMRFSMVRSFFADRTGTHEERWTL